VAAGEPEDHIPFASQPIPRFAFTPLATKLGVERVVIPVYMEMKVFHHEIKHLE
jgi:hypothetical protein